MATHSGLRGPGLSGADVERTVGGFLTLLSDLGLGGGLAMASDGRPGNEELCERVVETVTGGGLDLVDLGIVATPTAKIAARSMGLAGAVIVTASHLPHGWNGVKLAIGPDFFPVDVGALPPPPDGPGGDRGSFSRDPGAAAIHAAAVCGSVDEESIRGRGLVATVSGGAGNAPAIALERLGVRVAVGGADVQLHLDADADRLALGDEAGTMLDEEDTLALVALSRRPAAVVKGADTSRALDELVAGWGGAVTTVPPGELHLVEALSELGAELAGEGNGGVAIPAVAPARDGLGAAAAILQLLAREGMPLSELAAGLPRYERRRSRIECERPGDAEAALDALASWAGTGVDPGIGLRLDRGGDLWALVRPSATEPILRFTVEGGDGSDVERLHSELRTVAEAALAAR
jgi:phosphomannomutase